MNINSISCHLQRKELGDTFTFFALAKHVMEVSSNEKNKKICNNIEMILFFHSHQMLEVHMLQRQDDLLLLVLMHHHYHRLLLLVCNLIKCVLLYLEDLEFN